MTEFEREQLDVATNAALSISTQLFEQRGSWGYQWNGMVVIHPRILRELLDATEERTVAKRSTSE